MRPILWHVEPAADPPIFKVLFAGRPNTVATLRLALDDRSGDPWLAASRQLDALTLAEVDAIQGTAIPL